MNTTTSFYHSAKTGLFVLTLTALGLASSAADDALKGFIQQSQADQQDIRVHTSAVADQVQALIDELAANGISSNDSKVLEATKAALSHLSGPEMEKVLSSLQNASAAPDPTSTQQNAVKAYADQKGIILQFQKILADYAQRQAAYELPLKFKELTDRQTETLRTTTQVAARTIGLSASELSSMDSTTEQIVQSDQAQLMTEVAQAQDELQKAAQNSDGDDGKNMQQALTDLKTGRLQQAMAQATDEMNAGSYLKAIGDQKVARDELRRITQDLSPPSDLVNALTDLAGTLAALIDSQKKIMDQTNGAISSKTMDTGLKDTQVVLVDKADLLQKDMVATSPDASALVKDSINPMQVSRFKLGDIRSFPEAITSQTDVIAKLEAAEKLLQQQVADAEKAEEEANKDPVAKLEEMQQKIQNEIKQQTQLEQATTQADSAPTPDANQLATDQQSQNQLAQDTEALKQDSLASSLTAAQALSNAADQMNQAQKDMSDPANATPTQQAQTNALAALNQANNALGQQIAQDQQDQQPTDPDALAAAADAIQKAQDSASDATGDAAPPPPSTPDTSAASQALADAGNEAQTAANTPGLPQDAAQAVKDAQAEIAQGKGDADKKDAAGAAQHAEAAQKALAKAQSSVAMAQAAAMAGNAPGHGQNGPPPPPVWGVAGSTPGHNTQIAGGDKKKGVLHDVNGSDKFIALANRKRAVDDVSQGEKRPLEYAPMIDQYMKNLADQSSTQ